MNILWHDKVSENDKEKWETSTATIETIFAHAQHDQKQQTALQLTARFVQ